MGNWWDVITQPIQQAANTYVQQMTQSLAPPTATQQQAPAVVSAPQSGGGYSGGGGSSGGTQFNPLSGVVSSVQQGANTVYQGVYGITPIQQSINISPQSIQGIGSPLSQPQNIQAPIPQLQNLQYQSGMAASHAIIPQGMTLNVAMGDIAQQQVKNINAVVYDPVSGGWAGYTTPYGHSITNIVTGGGAGALQSGKFTVGEGNALTPVLYTQAGAYKGEFAPGVNVAAANMVLSNPEAYSHTGAERYGGIVSPLLYGEAGKLRAGIDMMGVYPASSGNLANLVSQQGVNQPKSTWSEVPWNISPSTQGIFSIDTSGKLTAAGATDLLKIGIASTPLSTISMSEATAKSPFLSINAPTTVQPGVSGKGWNPFVASAASPTGFISEGLLIPNTTPSTTTQNQKNAWDIQSPVGGLIGLALWGDKKDEVIRGAVGSSIDFVAGIVGQAPFKESMTTVDPTLVAWRAENTQMKATATPEEYNKFLQQSFEKGILTKPITSSNFVENPELTYGYGEFTKWGVGVGNTIKERIGITQPQLEAYQYNVEKTGSLTDRLIFGTGYTVSTHPEKIVSAYGGGLAMALGGEVVAGLYEGSALAATVGSFAVAHPTVAAISSGLMTYGIPTVLAGATYYGASEGLTATPERTQTNLGKMFPELVGVTAGVGTGYAIVRGMDVGYAGFQSKEVPKLPLAERPLGGEIPAGERVGNTVYFEGWEKSPTMAERGGGRPLSTFERVSERPTPEYAKPLGESKTSVPTSYPDWARATLRDDIASKAPESWRDIRTASQTIPEARPMVGEATYTIPKSEIASIEPANFFHDTTIKFKGSELPKEVKGSSGQTSIVQQKIQSPIQTIDLAQSLSSGRGVTAIGLKPEGVIRTSPASELARTNAKLYYSADNPMKLRQGYNIHNTNIKGTAPSGEGAGNWLQAKPSAEELKGYLRIALMERKPIEFPIQPDVVKTVPQDISITIGRQRYEPVSLGRIGFEPSTRTDIASISSAENIGAVSNVPKVGVGRTSISTSGNIERVIQPTTPIVSSENINQRAFAQPFVERLTQVPERPYVPAQIPSTRPVPERPYTIFTPEVTRPVPERPVPERPIVPTITTPERQVPERPYVPATQIPRLPIIPAIPIPPLIPGGGFGGGGGGSGGDKRHAQSKFTDIYRYGQGIGNFGTVNPIRFGKPPKAPAKPHKKK